VLVTAVVVVVVALLLGGSDDEPTGAPEAASSAPVVVDPGDVDVRIVLDEATSSTDAERAVGLITDATRMWQGGLAALEGADETAELVVSEQRVAGDGELVLEGADIVFVVASDVDAAGGSSLRVRADGEDCATYDDVFALGGWRERDGFNSHHRLPEGTYDDSCAGEPVCFAVNATFVAGGVDPMEAFGLVGDELGHCLGGTRASS
jgi:hypothetical protein